MGGRDLIRLFASIRGFETEPERLLDAVAGLFQAEGVSLFLSSPTRQSYLLAASYGRATGIPPGTVITEGEPIGGEALERREPLLLTDVGEEGRSSMVIPLFTAERAIGVINFSRGAKRGNYGPDDLARATALGAVLSFLFANALLLDELSSQRHRLDATVELLGVAAFFTDAGGRIDSPNPLARQLLGDVETLDEAFARLPQAMATALRELSQCLGPSNRQRIESGDRSFGISAERLEDGTTVWAIEDLTEREQLHAELARAQRLAEIGQMTAAIAHEIRNPLTSLVGAGKLLQKSPEMAAELGSMVEDEANRLNDLCDEFLAFARPMQLYREPVDLADLGRRVVDAHQSTARDGGIGLTLQICTPNPVIEADRARAEQVLHNLVLNAIQACNAGGSVRLLVSSEGFRVEDTGRGIEKDALNRLFTPFYSTRAKGTGLGLCNVKRIVDAHGGHIEVCRLERGTAFEVNLGSRAA